MKLWIILNGLFQWFVPPKPYVQEEDMLTSDGKSYLEWLAKAEQASKRSKGRGFTSHYHRVDTLPLGPDGKPKIPENMIPPAANKGKKKFKETKKQRNVRRDKTRASNQVNRAAMAHMRAMRWEKK